MQRSKDDEKVACFYPQHGADTGLLCFSQRGKSVYQADSHPAQAVNTVIVTDPEGVWKGANPTRLYVRHYLWSSIEGYYGSHSYTNYFQAFEMSDLDSRLGGDWMAPDTANYVRSNSIYAGWRYGAAARANTKYADAGFPTIQLSGYIDGDS